MGKRLFIIIIFLFFSVVGNAKDNCKSPLSVDEYEGVIKDDKRPKECTNSYGSDSINHQEYEYTTRDYFTNLFRKSVQILFYLVLIPQQ